MTKFSNDMQWRCTVKKTLSTLCLLATFTTTHAQTQSALEQQYQAAEAAGNAAAQPFLEEIRLAIIAGDSKRGIAAGRAYIQAALAPILALHHSQIPVSGGASTSNINQKD